MSPKRNPRPSAQPTEAELAVLESLWDNSKATIRELTDALYPAGGASHYATVQKLLERLEGKGLVRRERRGVPHRFSAKVDRGGLIAGRLREVADTLAGGSLPSMLTNLVEADGLSADDLRGLRALLDRLEAGEGE